MYAAMLRNIMKIGIHPKYETTTVTCTCGNTFETRSTLCAPLSVEVCAKCHPYYTGKQKLLDSEGRVERFKQRYGQNKAAQQSK